MWRTGEVHVVSGISQSDYLELTGLRESYEFWMKDANQTGGPFGLLAPLSAHNIGVWVLDQYWAKIESLLPPCD
jgi:hypothetical protein